MADQPNGTSEALTVDAAASVFEGLLSPPKRREDKPTREAAPVRADEDETDEVESEEVEELEPSGDADEHEPVDDEEESEETDEETDDEQESEPQKFRVKVDGEELEVPLDELLKGYSRTQDYTRKTQQLAEARKAFEEQELRTVREERQKLASQLSQLETALTSYVQEPDWDSLYAEDPIAYAETRKAWDEHQDRIAKVRAEREKADAQVAKDQAEQLKATVERERAKLLEVLPEWSDAEVAKKEKDAILAFATKVLGFGEEDLATVVDHRLVRMLRMAMLYDKAEKAKPKVREKIEKVRTATPGTANARKPLSESEKARQRLAKTGRIDDAALALKDLLD